MKYTDEQIQAAIDYAFSACPSSRLTTFRGGLNWTTEAPFRLAIAKNLLEKLPLSNSDTELERIIAAAHEAGWNGVENSKDLAQFILDFEHSIDAKYAKHIHPDDHDRRVKIVQDMAKVEIKELRDELATPNQYRIKPEPSTFEAHGKTWTRHNPGDAMPCANVRVDYLMRGRGGATIPSSRPELVIDIDWTADKDFESSEIIGWRYADKQPPPNAPKPSYEP